MERCRLCVGLVVLACCVSYVSALEAAPPPPIYVIAPAFVYEGWTAPLTNMTCVVCDPEYQVAYYSWNQVSGKCVGSILLAEVGSSASFTVPTLTLCSDQPLVFEVFTTDWHGQSFTVTVAVPAYMMGDITHDSQVNVGDLQSLVADWGTHATGHAADLDGDGYVNVGDLQALIANWGKVLF